MTSNEKKRALVACILGGILFALLLTAVVGARELSIRHQCYMHLCHFNSALHEYCRPPTFQYPSSLSQLSAEDVSVSDYVCPGSGEPCVGTVQDATDTTSDIYISGLNPTSPFEVPRVICPPINHGGKGGFLLLNSYALWMKAEELDELIDRTYAYANSNGLRIVVSESMTKRSNGQYKSSR